MVYSINVKLSFFFSTKNASSQALFWNDGSTKLFMTSYVSFRSTYSTIGIDSFSWHETLSLTVRCFCYVEHPTLCSNPFNALNSAILCKLLFYFFEAQVYTMKLIYISFACYCLSDVFLYNALILQLFCYLWITDSPRASLNPLRLDVL